MKQLDTLVVYLKCSNDNWAATVGQCFIEAATGRFGWPSCVRSDKGVKMSMLHFSFVMKGFNKGSHIAGSSTLNQRIERLERCLQICLCPLLFTVLHSPTIVNLLGLHYLFLLRIKRAGHECSEGYNHHPMRTAHNWSPYQLWYHSSIAAQNDDPIDLTTVT